MKSQEIIFKLLQLIFWNKWKTEPNFVPIQVDVERWPAGGARGSFWKSPKYLQCFLWGPWIYIVNFKLIHCEPQMSHFSLDQSGRTTDQPINRNGLYQSNFALYLEYEDACVSWCTTLRKRGVTSEANYFVCGYIPTSHICCKTCS